MYDDMTLKEELAARMAAATHHDRLVLGLCMVATARTDEAEAEALQTLYAYADATQTTQADIDAAEVETRAFMARHGLIEQPRFEAIPPEWTTDHPGSGR